MLIEGKSVLTAGGSAGIGRATAAECARQGRSGAIVAVGSLSALVGGDAFVNLR